MDGVALTPSDRKFVPTFMENLMFHYLVVKHVSHTLTTYYALNSAYNENGNVFSTSDYE
jgi:hypothetical protein